MRGLDTLLKKHYIKKDEERGASYETKSNTLRLLNNGYNMYAGTVDPATVAKRRAKNKVGRQSRRINRARGK